MHPHDELPSLHGTVRLDDSMPIEQWYDVKFYPYTPPGEDPVFAVVGGRIPIICRCVCEEKSSINVLRVFKDEQEKPPREPLDVTYNSVAWSQAENGDPLICIAGCFRQIRVLNVMTGRLVMTLIGHGANVNDLAISPIDPTILASASIDHTVRIWSLDPAHAKQPTAAKCFGEGHHDQVLTLAYHRKGKYLLSGGMDRRVNLWMIPDDLRDYMGTDKPALIHYPHFSTTEIHNDFVDCIRWYNDTIISHASNEPAIQLWKIDNFSSANPPPTSAPVPVSKVVNSDTKVTLAASSLTDTRSAWGDRFQRLLQFDMPGHNLYFMRFDLFHELGAHPILVAGNTKKEVFFWDLQRLEGDEDDGDVIEPQPNESTKGKKSLPRSLRDTRSASNISNASGAQSTPPAPAKGKGKEKAKIKRDIGNPFEPITAHKKLVVKNQDDVTFRQFAWSRDGQWCVGVGGPNLMAVMHRWADGVPPAEMRAGP